MLRTALLTSLLALTAPARWPPRAHDGGEGWWGETNDLVITNAGFILIAGVPPLSAQPAAVAPGQAQGPPPGRRQGAHGARPTCAAAGSRLFTPRPARATLTGRDTFLVPTAPVLPRRGARRTRLQMQPRASSSVGHDRCRISEEGPTRSTATDRTCSACAFESCPEPGVGLPGAGSGTGTPAPCCCVTGTSVTTPRPRRSAAALARLLLTRTAGPALAPRRYPRVGSRSTSRTSPRQRRRARRPSSSEAARSPDVFHSSLPPRRHRRARTR